MGVVKLCLTTLPKNWLVSFFLKQRYVYCFVNENPSVLLLLVSVSVLWGGHSKKIVSCIGWEPVKWEPMRNPRLTDEDHALLKWSTFHIFALLCGIHPSIGYICLNFNVNMFPSSLFPCLATTGLLVLLDWTGLLA